MWSSLAHCTKLRSQIMTQYYIRQTEVGCWTVRQMADYQAIRLASMLMYNDEITEIIRTSGFDQFLDDCITAIQSLCIWEEKTHLLQELRETAGRVARGG